MTLPRFCTVLFAVCAAFFILVFAPHNSAQAITYSLTISSDYGTPSPSAGTTAYQSGVTVFCSVEEYVQTENGVRMYCSGWTGTGSVDQNGSTNSFHFTISANSTLSWQWEEYYELVVQCDYDIDCAPELGSRYILKNSVIDFGAPLFFKDHLFDGYQGSGAISYGSDHFLSVALTVPSTITWFYRSATLTATPDFSNEITVVDSSAKVGKYNSIKINPQTNLPSIAYFDEDNGDLKYAAFNGKTWDVVTVDSGILVGKYTSLVFDSSFSPIILYYSYGYRDLCIARKDIEGNWYTDIVDQDLMVGSYCDIVVLSGDRLGVSYYDETNHNLLYRENKDGFWSPEPHLVVDDGGDGENTSVGTYSSIAVNPISGEPAIAYRSETEDCLYFTYREDGEWIVQKVTSTAGTGYFIDLAFDNNGVAYIAHQDFKNDPRTIDLMLAQQAGNTWVSHEVITSVDIGFYNSLVIDAYGYPHITTYDDSSLGIRYIMWNGRYWVSKLIDKEGSHVGLYTSLTFDKNGYPHMAYCADDTLRYTFANSWGSIQEEPPTPIIDETTGSGSGGGCFIATAAFSSYTNFAVSTLCDIRDTCGATSESGLSLVALYYNVSPEVASCLSNSDAVRAVLRKFVAPGY